MRLPRELPMAGGNAWRVTGKSAALLAAKPTSTVFQAGALLAGACNQGPNYRIPLPFVGTDPALLRNMAEQLATFQRSGEADWEPSIDYYLQLDRTIR